MKTGSLRALALAAAAVAVSAPTGATAQHGGDENALLAMLQREMDKSTQLLEQFWDAAFGGPAPADGGDHEDDPVLVLEVLDDAPSTAATAATLTDEEKTLACRVAVQGVQDRVAMAREAQRVVSRLRTPLGGIVTLQFEGGASCEDLEGPALARECARVAAMDEQIAQFLKEGKTAEEICDVVKLAEEMVEDEPVMEEIGEPPLSCKLCKRFVQMVDDAIAKDMSQVQQVREILGDICDSMSADSMCHTFLKHYDDVVNWLVHGTDPQVVCERLTMCTAVDAVDNGAEAAALSATVNRAPAADAVGRVDRACFVCEHIAGTVAFVLQHAPGQLETLHTLLKFVCKLSPKDCKCDVTVANYGKIVDWTKQGKSPEVICAALGLCMKTDETRLPASVEGMGRVGLVLDPTFVEAMTSHISQRDRADKKCFYCEYFTTLLEVAIQADEQDMDQIREFADLICGVLGDNKYCQEYVSKLDTAIDDIKKGEKPHEICTDMQFCPKKADPALPLSAAVVTPGDKQCFYCDYFVTLLEVAIQEDDADVEQLRQYADLVCGMLGDDSVCHQYVDKFDAAVDALKQGKKPHEICTEFKFCSKSKLLALPAPPRLVNGGDQNCFYCEYFVTILDVILREDKADIDQVWEFADMICGMLGDDSACHAYVDKFDAAVDGLQKGKKPREVCVDLKFCSSKSSQALMQPAAVSDEKKCVYCDYFVTILEVFIAQDDTDINLVRQYADLICGMLGDDNICHQYVNKFDVIVDELKQGKRPRAICADIKFCTQAQTLALPAATPPMVEAGDNKTCFYCDYFVTILEVALQEDPNDVDALRLYANIVCGMLGDGNVCHQYLIKFEYAIDALNKGKKPPQICTEFKYCNAKQPALADSAVLNSPLLLKDAMVKSVKASPAVGSVDECFFCTQVSSLLKVAVAQDPSKVAEIRTIADLVCKALPAANKCHAVMRELDQIIDSLKKGEEPGDICRDMKFCKKAVASVPLAKAAHGVKDNTCAYCDGVATVLEYALKSKPEQVQQLREAAGIVCDFMPQDDKCHDDLKMFDKAVQELKNGKSPHSVCVEFNLCKDEDAAASFSKMMSSSVAKLDSLAAKTSALKESAAREKSMSMGCLLCEYTAEGLVLIKGDASELRLAKQALETMCIVLPPNARCDVLSSKFDALVALVGEGKSPSQACHALSLCDAAFVEPPTMTTTDPKRISAIVAEQ